MYLSAAATISGVFKYQNTPMAAAVSPTNGFAVARAADLLIKQNIEQKKQDEKSPLVIAKNRQEIQQLAINAYYKEPLSEAAIRNIALTQYGPKSLDKARIMMRHGLKFSKRDYSSNLWLLRDDALAQNVGATLLGFDRAMRTNNAASDLLLPGLIQAVQQDVSIKPLVKLLNDNPEWEVNFWAAGLANPQSLVNLSKIRLAQSTIGKKMSAAENEDLDQNLIQLLINNQKFDDAFALFDKKNGVVAQNKNKLEQVVNADFTMTPKLKPFDWNLFSNTGQEVFIDGPAGKLNIDIFGFTNGLFAQQLVRIPTGKYLFSTNMEQQGAAKHYAKLQCAEPKLTALPAIEFAMPSGKKQSEFSNISPCRYFWLKLRADLPNGASSQASINQISIRRQSGS
ncbi:hypothetical protein [Sphingorhabdus lutea]|uniref:hypothetical protein n=1 Tax=Sphingorhabdus lutea TaxID=1913578 RepID=UPI0012EC7244|nr:hypothetical protein [Sphingorhabdus lutea]